MIIVVAQRSYLKW